MRKSSIFTYAFSFNIKFITGLLLFTFISLPGKAQVFEDLTVIQCDSLITANHYNPNFVILDVRTAGEYLPQHLEGAINRDYYNSEFSNMLDSLNKQKTYLIHCKSGGRSGLTLGLMEDLGFTEVYNMLGGMNAWNGNSLPTTTEFGPRIMFVSDSVFTNEVINIGETDTIKVTVTNRANSLLTFDSISSLEGTEFATDFNPDTTLLGAHDYSFNIYYSPTDEVPDTLHFHIESNAGELMAEIYREGFDSNVTHLEYV